MNIADKPVARMDAGELPPAKPAAPEKTSEREQAIRARVAAGLTRAQAEEVQSAQEEHDKALAASKKK
jgi:hypothetical protein